MAALSIRWPEAHSDAKKMAGLAAGARTLLGFDLVRVPFDQTVEAGLLGAEVALGDEHSNCSARSHPFTLAEDPPPLPDFGAGRAGVVAEALALLKVGDAAVIGGIVGPFTLVCQMAGVQEALMGALRKPDAVRRWLDFAVAAGVEYARRQVSAGADAICVEDMSASLDLTSPNLYRNLILPAQQRLIAQISAPVILHICGSNTKILDSLFAAGAAALSLESRTDLAQAAAGPCAVVGGIDPVGVLLEGGAADVRRAANECLAAGVHLLAPGCGVPAATPMENLQEITRAAREWPC
jgi:[methyl-Co(III) methanol-specific corrinoid protein]:coenzyme M methyltransferase